MSSIVSSVDVATIAAGLAAVSGPWDLGVAAPPASRRYAQVLATDAYDAWLIYWPAGTSTGVHDHGFSVGALAVVAGALEEDAVFDGHTQTTHVSAGEVLPLPAHRVHAVFNRGRIAATSVHVYSPPLRSMGFYREDQEGRLVLDRIEDATA